MKVHEYQAKQLLARFGVSTPRGDVATSADEAVAVAQELATLPVVVKAQIHAGGRGKGGGVKLARSLDEVRELAGRILGMRLVTPQTGPEGKVVGKVLIEEGLNIAKELYCSVLLDRSSVSPLIMASEAGGMEIEEVARTRPEMILKQVCHPTLGLLPFQARRLAFGLNLKGEAFKGFVRLITSLHRAFLDLDCSLAEINPLVVTAEGKVIALDAKMNFDDNGLYRHPEVAGLRDLSEEDPLEVEAHKFNLNYIKLDGNIGIMVNGAGLAMATMDVIKLAGAHPANFLDVGGGASAEMITNGFKILLSDKHVRAVLINIFGGILRCDVLAEGVVTACREVKPQLPVIVRLTGTNVEKGRQILGQSGLDFMVATDVKDAADKIAGLNLG
ncbi:MAG: ADP-forming succinate--CoA ligase subunit beta [Pseudomonadota bacterium]